ncbi:hypothetical protein [Catenulispora acidiphila]|uniref:hypothetical protein n=1 Tax=Catenulispora acidiphila TaxID=304895 RepID=UPI00117E3F23|nr:hypothetical protein [Catenulispora acidiphila]
MASVLAGLDQYDLTGLFGRPRRSTEEVEYRQRVFRDLDGTALNKKMTKFSASMALVRRRLEYAGKLSAVQDAGCCHTVLPGAEGAAHTPRRG